MPAAQAIDISLSDLLDALPDGVVWSKPIHDESGQIVDFRVIYTNSTLEQLVVPAYAVVPGMLWREVLAAHPQIEPTSFESMVAVLETGVPYEYSFQDKKQNLWYTIRRSRLSGGVLSVLRDVSALKDSRQQAAAQKDLMLTMLDGAINGVLLLEPVYDQGQLID
ncbi:MAG TPA: hypothetical protein VGB67_09665, partial [Fibrella sp.]